MRNHSPSSRLRLAGAVGLPALAAISLSCVSPPLSSPPPGTMQETRVRIVENAKNKVDVLFMVDNSNSMEAMAQELRNRFGQFFQVFQDLADPSKTGGNPTYADLNIGVVTSDYGAGATGAPGCTSSPGGDFGRLQAIGKFAPQTCQKPLQDKNTGGGTNYIHYNFDPKADPTTASNLPPGQNLIQTFTCMATVGSQGCGFEHQLESVYAALHNNLPDNTGFLRPDALLTVVFVTNEDDSSSPPDTDIFDKNKVAMYGYESSYRQTRFGVDCCPAGMRSCSEAQKVPTPYADSTGPLAGCEAAPNPDGSGPGREYDISRFITFFTKPASAGGIKVNPSDVILVGIDAPGDPVQVILSNPGTAGGQPYQQCGTLNETSNPPCVPVLQHSCQNSANPVFFGDPAVRLNTVINAAHSHSISSICDADYTGALQGLAKLIAINLGKGCISSSLPDPNHPDCVVEDVTTNADGTTTRTQIPNCANANGAFPCWRIETKAECSLQSPQSLGITIDRNGGQVPPNTEAQVACATIAGQ
jgi:hypothetical protein